MKQHPEVEAIRARCADYVVVENAVETAEWLEKHPETWQFPITVVVQTTQTKNNYDREFAYIHPAVIVKNTFDRVFIVPCTSRNPRVDKDGKVFPEYMTAKIKDGFEKKSVLMLNEAKFVDKNRVVSKIGKVTKEFYDKLYNELFRQLFESKYYEIEKLNKMIKK